MVASSRMSGLAKRNKAHESAVVGLARIPAGAQFRCGDCAYFGRDKPKLCDNPHPKLHDVEVDAKHECCNLYDHPGMRVIIS